MSFSENLKKLRSNAGLTQNQLAKELGVSTSTLGMYEIGKREPDNTTLLKLASFFKVTTDSLLGNDHEKASDNIPNLEAEQLAHEIKSNPKYLELHRLVKNMPKKEIDEVLDFAKYKQLKGNDRGPNDEDDF